MTTTLRRLSGILAALAFSLLLPAVRAADQPPVVHFVWFGGNDCPPCVYWRATELPKLQKSPLFAAATYSYVTKTIRSSIPSSLFLPAEVKPLKDQLDAASGGRAGSPQAAVFVDGKLYDYFRGTRSAQDVGAMLLAIKSGSTYPFKRCLKVASDSGRCSVYAES